MDTKVQRDNRDKLEIIFLIFQQKHILWNINEMVLMRGHNLRF